MEEKSIYESMEKIQQQYYNNNNKNILFKKSQKLDCATKLCQSPEFHLETAIKNTVYILPDSNRIFFNYEIFKYYGNPENYEVIVNYILSLILLCISKYSSFEFHTNINSFTISAAERYKPAIQIFVTKCLANNTEFSKLLTKMHVYNSPSIMNEISRLLKPMIDPAITNPVKAENFTAIFQHLKLFTDAVNILFEESGIYIQTMDNTRVSILELKIPCKWFDSYYHKGNSTISIGLSSSLLFKILNTRDKLQSISVSYNPDTEDKLSIQFTCINIDNSKPDIKGIFDKHFEIPLIDITEEHMTIPEMDFQAEIVLPSSIFASNIQQLKLFGETIEITCNEEKIMLCSNSVENGKMFVEIKIDDVEEFSINEGDNLAISYSLNYLNNICLYHKITKNIQIKLYNDFPMRIYYDLGDDASIVFYLAPKINDD
jgi:proliferating cell nuclear antigen